MKIEEKIQSLGYALPPVPKPVAAYVPWVRTGSLVFTAGQIPLADGVLKYRGKVGGELTIEQGYEAARLCTLNALAAIKAAVGDLDRVSRIVKVVVFVNSAPGFTDQPKVANGASEFLANVFGEAGQHARSAVGVSDLPLGSACEVELIAEVSGT